LKKSFSKIYVNLTDLLFKSFLKNHCASDLGAVSGGGGALALISNCQITFAWVISRPDACERVKTVRRLG